MMKDLRRIIRSIGLTILAPTFGFSLFLIVEIAFHVEVPKLVLSLLNLALVTPIALVIFPKVLGIPFGRIDTGSFLRGIGLSFPRNGWKHIFLGLLLAGLSLAGMLFAATLTGKFSVNFDRITLTQLVFSLNPAVWEELFYRGVLMILLLQFTHSLKKSFLIQVALFALLHIKELNVWGLVDALTVGIIAIGFTYTAYKTRTLLAGIIFHYFHDAFLFFVQVPGDVLLSGQERAAFYGILWLMILIGCFITRLAAEHYNVRGAVLLYSTKKDPTSASASDLILGNEQLYLEN